MVRVHTLRVTKWEEVRRGKETVSNGLEDGATLLRENNTVYHRRVIRGLLSFCFFFLEEAQRKAVSSSVLEVERIDFNLCI